jgi:hypothetical protein
MNTLLDPSLSLRGLRIRIWTLLLVTRHLSLVTGLATSDSGPRTPDMVSCHWSLATVPM